MADGRGELVQDAGWSWILGDALAPRPAVIDVDDAAGAPDGHPPVAAERVPPAVAAEGDYRRAHGAVVVPARDRGPPLQVPLRDLPVLPRHAQPGAVRPPAEIRDAAVALDAGLRNPLQGVGAEDVDSMLRCSSWCPYTRVTRSTAPEARFQTWKYFRRAPRNILGSSAEGWKSVVVMGVFLTCRVVRRGFGFGGCGCRWYRAMFELGPEDMSSGRELWTCRHVTADCRYLVSTNVSGDS
jgi:hypothetical protein